MGGIPAKILRIGQDGAVVAIPTEIYNFIDPEQHYPGEFHVKIVPGAEEPKENERLEIAEVVYRVTCCHPRGPTQGPGRDLRVVLI